MMHSLPGIRFHTRVRYVSAGLNNLKSELSISVNCYTSVNVDLSMSLNCSIYVCTQYWQAWVVVKKKTASFCWFDSNHTCQIIMGSKSADIWLTTTNACLAGSIPVLSTHFFVFLIVSGKLYHCDRVKAGSDSPGIR